MKVIKKSLPLLLILLCIILTYDDIEVHGASSPYDVPSKVRNNWNDIFANKSFSMTSGKKLVYDVYSDKYINNGYRIVNRNFGNGTKAYINFEGWSILFGYAKHTYANNETYIVAQEIGNTSNTKIYSTTKTRGLSATKDLEYNRQGDTGLYNECPSNARNKNNSTCNMRYNNVDFQAYIPFEDLFPNAYESGRWRLYIAHEIEGRLVYAPLILPFTFNNIDYLGGEISLSSGVNANKLIMNGNGVLRRSYPEQPQGEVTDELGSNRHFTTNRTYTQVRADQSSTAVWYGVRSPHDSNKTKWATTAYWTFGGDQATVQFTPDDKPPIHVSDSIKDHRYKNGNDYWVQPYDEPIITLRQRDVDSGNRSQYMRLMQGDEIITRNRHDFYDSASTNRRQITSNDISVDKARRTENTSYGRVEWTATPKVHGETYNIEYFYRDMANNELGYNRIAKRLRVDGVEPQHQSHNISGASYVNGNNYWVNSDDELTVTLRQRDVDSGNKYQYLRLLDENVDVRKRHNFSADKNYIAGVSGDAFTDDSVSIVSANRTEESSYGTVQWEVVPHSHGNSYNVMYYYQDNVDNKTTSNDSYDYADTNLKIKVDDLAPDIMYRDEDDKINLPEREWHHSDVNVRLKFTDDDSGYKESRYAWSKSSSKPKESDWSNWSTNSNYVVNQKDFGEWYLHVQAVDNVGNIVTTHTGLYKVNQPPIPDFDYPEPLYEGDPLVLDNKSVDPEGHKMTAIWTIEDPDGETETFDSWDVTINRAKAGKYTVNLEVTDEYGAKDDITKTISVIPLTIQGEVSHTDEWKEVHEYYNHSEDQFYSGERFILDAYVTNYPVKQVDVTLIGEDVSNNSVELNEHLSEQSRTSNVITMSGSMYEEFLAQPLTKLKDGTVDFIFKSEWENGVIKEDIVQIKIVDDIYEPYLLHRSN